MKCHLPNELETLCEEAADQIVTGVIQEGKHRMLNNPNIQKAYKLKHLLNYKLCLYRKAVTCKWIST